MTVALQCLWSHKIWSIITLICFCVGGIRYVMQRHVSLDACTYSFPTGIRNPVPHDIFVMDDSRLHCDMRQRTESFKKNTGLICNPRNRSLTLSQFPAFFFFLLFHPRPQSSLHPYHFPNQARTHARFFFPTQNGTQISDLEWLPFWWQFIPLVPNRTPSCSNAPCLHALVHIIEIWFIWSSVNTFVSQFIYCTQFKWCGR